jgi:hypothetical protein
MNLKSLRRVALAAGLVVGPLVLSAPAHAASAAVKAGACGGPVFNSFSATGFTVESVQWDCSDAGTGHSAAVGDINGSSFSGTWYDNYCQGEVHGTVAGTELVGLLTNVTCTGSSTVRSGTFVLTHEGLVGALAVTR